MILRFTIFAALFVLAIEAKKYPQPWEEHEEWQEFEEFLKWKKAKRLHENHQHEIKYEKHHDKPHNTDKFDEKQVPIDPPPIDQAALMARYIVNQADWVSIATISTRKEIESFPTVNLVSFTDGLTGNGSGIPYLYLTPLDFTGQDVVKDNRVTLLMTLAQGDYCKSKQWDPMDPRCARVMMSGKIKTIKNDSMELENVKKIFFYRHPKLAKMPSDHHFYFVKLKIMSIVVLDTFGGPKYVDVKDYLHPPIVNVTEEFNRVFPSEFYENDSQNEPHPISSLLHPVVRSV